MSAHLCTFMLSTEWLMRVCVDPKVQSLKGKFCPEAGEGTVKRCFMAFAKFFLVILLI